MASDSVVLRSAIGNGLAVNSDGSINTNAVVVNSLITSEYDEIVLTYVTSGNGIGEIETAIYKLASIVVNTLTLSYDGNNKLSSVVRS